MNVVIVLPKYKQCILGFCSFSGYMCCIILRMILYVHCRPNIYVACQSLTPMRDAVCKNKRVWQMNAWMDVQVTLLPLSHPAGVQRRAQ